MLHLPILKKIANDAINDVTLKISHAIKNILNRHVVISMLKLIIKLAINIFKLIATVDNHFVLRIKNGPVHVCKRDVLDLGTRIRSSKY